MMPTIYKSNGVADFVEHAAKAIESFLVEQLKKKKIVRIALSGGSSPIPVYEALAESKKMNWSRIALFLVDERYVPLNSKESNARMIKEALADNVKNLRRFYHYNTREPITTLVDQYQKLLKLQQPPLFDLVILGLGQDGHTASLFPHSETLHEKRRLVTYAQSPSGHDRLTLTFPSILSSEKIVFLIQGKDKKPMVKQWLQGNDSVDDLPAKRILDHANVEIFLSL